MAVVITYSFEIRVWEISSHRLRSHIVITCAIAHLRYWNTFCTHIRREYFFYSQSYPSRIRQVYLPWKLSLLSVDTKKTRIEKHEKENIWLENSVGPNVWKLFSAAPRKLGSSDSSVPGHSTSEKVTRTLQNYTGGRLVTPTGSNQNPINSSRGDEAIH